MNDFDHVEDLVAATRAEFEPTHADRERVRRHLGAKLAGAGLAGSVAVKATAATTATTQGGTWLAGQTLLGLGKLWVSTVLVTVGTGTAVVAASRAISSHGAAQGVAPRSVDAPARSEPPSRSDPRSEPPSRADAPNGDPTGRAPDTVNTTEPPILEARAAAPGEPASPGSAAAPKGTPRAPSVATGVPGAPLSPGPDLPTLNASAPDSHALDAELALLHEAKRAMTSGNFGSALAVLAQLDREHPAGALLEEREALGVVITCKAGDAKRAERVAAFRRRYAHSVYASRVESACAPGASAGSENAKSFTDPKEGGH